MDADHRRRPDEPLDAGGENERAGGGADGAAGDRLAARGGAVRARAPGNSRSGVRATATARRLWRMSSPICSASPSEPPREEIRTGRRRPLRSGIALRNAPAVPGMMRPSAEIHSGQFGSQAGSELVTRTMRIGGSPRGRGGSLEIGDARTGRSRQAPDERPRSSEAAQRASASRDRAAGDQQMSGELSRRRRSGARRLAPEALVFESDEVRPVSPLEPAHDEMAARQRLEMLGEGGVDRRAADRAEDRRRLRRDLLADHDAEARGDLRDEAGRRPAPIWAATPWAATKRALSVTDLASAARTAK